ncbi:hypothetical protein CEXT_569311 [Caerostris extrusa]|uniref:EB domain-containing protein n=1 Tax=Caerostris extrusa TaxID=172846 RepID=A0AAV4UPS1_CAEEX|nr:hypothetical protein CEXT_569311 [Caerostris extrusa]
MNDSFMAPCNVEEDCDIGIRLTCKSGHCVCKPGDLFIEWPKYGCFTKIQMFGQCEVSGQCVAMNSNTYCNPDNGRCTCSPNYFYNGRECTIRYDGSNLKAQEVYKAAVVAAACFIVAIVGIFVACIVRRSFCRRDQHLQQQSNREGDIFSISDEIAALRAVDKPPSYEEVLQIERTFYGIPPPEYAPTPRIISSLSAFEPPHGSVQSSRSGEYLKDANPVAEGAVGGTDNTPIPEADAATNFLAAAEVLPPPSDNSGEVFQISIPAIPHSSVNPSHQAQYISSTPPPPRLHRPNLHSGSSSSLPSSPNLSSIRVLNLPNPLRKELLKQNSLPSEHHISVENHPQISPTVPNSPGAQRIIHAASNSSSGNSSSELAYDNLGFVSE